MPNHGIGVRNERSLHAALKRWYARPGDETEVSLDGYIVDILRGDMCIEIQTRNLASVRSKLCRMLENHRVHLIYPIPAIKWIVRTTLKDKTIGKRKSPKRGELTDLFDELVSVPDLISHPNFSLEIAMIEQVEIRRQDGRGSWRRRGASICDRRLERVIETVCFENKDDFIRFVPAGLPEPFTNSELGKRMGLPDHVARRVTYCLRKMGAIRQVGKKGRALLFKVIREDC